METTLRIAIQTKGRLNEDSILLLNESGIKLIDGKRRLISSAKNFPLEVLYLRDDDIPQCVADGVADVGIVGKNEMDEQKKVVEVIKYLGFSKCRLSLAVPKDIEYPSLLWFNNKKIATSYPVMIANPLLSKEKQAILDELIFRIESVENGRGKKYILLNAPNEKMEQIIKVLPGMTSPTLMPLAKPGWSSLHSVITESEFWEVIGNLKRNGAEGILVLPIEKIIF